MTNIKAVGQFVYQIYVNETLYRGSVPLDVQLTQEWGRHDIFSLRIEYPRLHPNPNSIQFWPDGAPVRIIWGRKPDNVNTWYGYVNHHENMSPADSGYDTFQTTYILIGTSKPMNTDTNRSWGRVTPTYIAKTIAAKYGLRAVLSSTDWILPFEMQVSESDFKFLNRLANKCGYRFWVSGGTLYFVDPTVVLMSGNLNSVPVFRQDKTFWQHDTMRRFRQLRGDNLPGSVVAERTLFGMTPENQIINLSTGNSNAVVHQKNTRYVESFAEGKKIVQAWQNMSQFWIGAEAELYGSILVYPGKIVNIQGNWLPGGNQGYWIISKACHELKSAYSTRTSDDWYVTKVQMLRNNSGNIPNIKEMQIIKPEFVNCSLVGNSWKAVTNNVIYDGVT